MIIGPCVSLAGSANSAGIAVLAPTSEAAPQTWEIYDGKTSRQLEPTPVLTLPNGRQARRPLAKDRRRHTKKSRDWVKKHCFPALSNRDWTLAAKTEKQTAGGNPVWPRLVYAGETKIRRYVKIRRRLKMFRDKSLERAISIGRIIPIFVNRRPKAKEYKKAPIQESSDYCIFTR